MGALERGPWPRRGHGVPGGVTVPRVVAGFGPPLARMCLCNFGAAQEHFNSSPTPAKTFYGTRSGGMRGAIE